MRCDQKDEEGTWERSRKMVSRAKGTAHAMALGRERMRVSLSLYSHCSLGSDCGFEGRVQWAPVRQQQDGQNVLYSGFCKETNRHVAGNSVSVDWALKMLIPHTSTLIAVQKRIYLP